MKDSSNFVVLMAACLLLALCAGACAEGSSVSNTEVVEDIISDVPAPDDIADVLEVRVDTPEDIFKCPAGMEECTPCKEAADCDDVFPEMTVCQKAACDDQHRVCMLDWVEEGTTCSDGDVCNGEETCQTTADGLECEPGDPLVCDDSNLCNGAETCDPADGCQLGQPLTCDDANLCNGVESCDPADGCKPGEALVCIDEDVCNGEETCDPIDGCMPGESLVCDDEDVCNGEETCDPIDGCTPGESLVCADEDVCNGAETCDPIDGCQPGEELLCDDADACNGLETCDPIDGCTAGEPPVCADENICNGEEFCDPVQGCMPGAQLICDDGNKCNGQETCDETLGCLLGKPLSCDDGNKCNGKEICDPVDGCKTGLPLDCNDDNDCTTDSCFPVSGCVNAPNDNPGCCTLDADCDDGNPCSAEYCDDVTKACVFEALEGPCDDGAPCTTGDTCLEGQCVADQTLAACGAICTLFGQAGTTVKCAVRLARAYEEDAPPVSLSFTTSYDQSVAQLTTLVDLFCLDADNCSSNNIPEGGTSLVETGHSVYLTPTEPGDWAGKLQAAFENLVNPMAPLSLAVYETDIMKVEAHLVSIHFKLLEDVSSDAGIPVLIHDVSAFRSGNVPLAVTMVANAIVTGEDGCAGTLDLCFDGKQCTADVCNEDDATCSYDVQEGPCDDGNPCTLGDFCDPVGDCVPQTAAPLGTECVGDDLCNEIGECDGSGACEYLPEMAVECEAPPSDCAAYECNPDSGGCALVAFAPGTPCTDGNTCTVNDGCNGLGACKGTALDCDDQIDCTADSCDNGQCAHQAMAALCDDNNICTDDACTDQGCSYTPLGQGDCDDNDACTLSDTCTAGECKGEWDGANCGCNVSADCIGLDDGNPCTGAYVCLDGACVVDQSTVVVCPAYSGDCLFWECDPSDGQCKTAPAGQGTECDNACLVDGACDANGACAGEALDCNDGDECTVDTCNPVAGCVNAQEPDCESKFCICELSGTAGQDVACPLMLVRESQGTPPAIGADYKLSWDPNLFGLKNFEDEFCFGAVCVPKKLPTCAADGTSCLWGSLVPTGHNILAVPGDQAKWTDHGTLLFFHPSDPTKTIAEAYLENAAVVGDDAVYLISHFTLASDIPENEPECLWMNNPHFSLPTGESLKLKIQDTADGRAIVVSK